MKHFYVLILLIFHIESIAQELGLTGKQFFALSVSSTDSVSNWYENVFDLKLLKEIKSSDGVVDIRIIGNDNLMIEILSHKNSKALTDCGISSDQSYRMKGIFKIGLFVKNVEAAQAYLQRKDVVITNKIFQDKETETRSFVISDMKQNLIQFIQIR